MKQSITAPSYAVNNVSNLPDIVKNQATTVKTTFDKASVDIKAYETNLIAELNGNNGSKKIGHNSLNIASDNVGDAIEEVYQAITSTVLGEIPDNSITNNKLAVDAKVGSIATLTTTEKGSVVGAINEIDAYVNGVPEQVDTVETNLNILRTAKATTGSNVALAVDTDGTFDMTRNGNTLTVIPNVANTGAMTIAVDGQTARAIQKANDAGTLVALEAGDIKQNVPVQLVLQTSGTPVFIYAPKGGSNIKSIQKGSVTLDGVSQLNVTVSSINTAKSILIFNYFSGAETQVPNSAMRGKILNSTQLQFNMGVSEFTKLIRWQLIEFANVKSLQRGSSLNGNVAITSVDIAKAVIFDGKFSTATAGTNPSAMTYNMYFSSATELAILGSDGTYDWQIVEF